MTFLILKPEHFFLNKMFYLTHRYTIIAYYSQAPHSSAFKKRKKESLASNEKGFFFSLANYLFEINS